MRGAKGMIRGDTWRDPASLLTSENQEELGRAGERSSFGFGKGGYGSPCVVSDGDGFDVGLLF
jgi:hypothetical protein